MNLFVKTSRLFLLFSLVTISCRKSFNPPALQGNNHFLAADGIIQTGNGAVSTFTINRSLDLADTIPDIPELNAHVQIQASDGSVYILQDVSGMVSARSSERLMVNVLTAPFPV
jgi:hypothetical protein